MAGHMLLGALLIVGLLKPNVIWLVIVDLLGLKGPPRSDLHVESVLNLVETGRPQMEGNLIAAIATRAANLELSARATQAAFSGGLMARIDELANSASVVRR